MSVALHGIHEGLQTPSIVTREIIADNWYLRDSLVEYGFGIMTRIEAPQDVLVATLDHEGDLVAAGMLVKSPHLMMNPRSSRPEIHVHSGLKEISNDGNGIETTSWAITDLARDAAGLTVHALLKIAHSRDLWSIKEPVIGLPPSDDLVTRKFHGDVPIWAVERPFSVR